MELGAGGALKGEISRFADDRREFFGRHDRLHLSPLNNEPGDLRGVGFIAKFEKRLRQFSLAHPVENR